MTRGLELWLVFFFMSLFVVGNTSCRKDVVSTKTQVLKVKDLGQIGKVQTLINRLEGLIQKNAKGVAPTEFDLSALNVEEMGDLYFQLYEKRLRHGLYSKLAFEVKDRLIRRAFNDPDALSFYRGLSTTEFMRDVDFNRMSFRSLSDSTSVPNFIFGEAVEESRKLLVLHVSFEAPNARVGGIAEYLSGLLKSELERQERLANSVETSPLATQVDGRLLTPFYDFLKSKFLDEARFVGFVKHFVDGAIQESSVYQVRADGIIQYLVQPDPNYRAVGRGTMKQGWEIFDVISESQLYSAVANDVGWIYFSSAAASVAAQFSGEDGRTSVDVLHINGRNLAFVNLILSTQLNGQRIAAGLPKIGILSTLHDTSESEINCDSIVFERLGLERPTSTTVNLNLVMNSYSDTSNIVSKSMASEVTRPDFWETRELGTLLTTLTESRRFFGVNNGIFFKNFDVTRPSVLGNLHVAPDHSDYSEKKQETKRVLFRNRVIGSETRPLFLYVGRFSWEKGIDLLSDFAKHIVTHRGGQVVIMGTVPGGVISPVVRELLSLGRDARYQGMIKVYFNYAADQLAPLHEVGASKGKLIRFASDFTIVPSVNEAAGLVPIEGLSMGSATITSYVQGLKDQCRRPLHRRNLEGEVNGIRTLTCIPFERTEMNPRQTIRNMIDSTDAALDEWSALSSGQQTEIQLSLIREAKSFDWSAENGPLDQYLDIYRRTKRFSFD